LSIQQEIMALRQTRSCCYVFYLSFKGDCDW